MPSPQWRPIEELSLFNTGEVFLATLEIEEGHAIPDILAPNDVSTDALYRAGYTYFWDSPFPRDVLETHPYIGDETNE